MGTMILAFSVAATSARKVSAGDLGFDARFAERREVDDGGEVTVASSFTAHLRLRGRELDGERERAARLALDAGEWVPRADVLATAWAADEAD